MMYRSLLLLAALGACTGATPSGPSQPTPAPAPEPDALVAAAADDARCTPPSDASPLGQDAALRIEALRALDEGRASIAKQKLEEVLKRHPGNYAAGALLEGVNATIDKHKSKALQAFESIKRVRPTRAPEDYTLKRAIEAPKGPVPALSNMRQQRNNVTDTDNWFAQNGLTMPTLTHDKLPAHVPATLAGSGFEQAIDHGDHTIVIFGPNVAVLRPDGAVVRVFDLTIFNMARHRPRVMWAQARDGVLYLMTSNMHYASESNGKNAYLSAIDLDDGALRWRSQPLVGNSYNFVMAGGYLLSGYGFTAESDYLYVLERSTGKVAKRIALGTKPEIILRSGGALYVRGYDVDYRFDLGAVDETPPRPVDEGIEVTEARLFGDRYAPSDDDRCRVDAAMLHLDHGRYADAAAALWKVDREYKNAPAIDALRRFINTAQSGATIDLQRRPVTVDGAQDIGKRGRHPALPSEPVPRLVQKSVQHNAISDVDNWLRLYGGDHAARRVPNPWTSEAGDLPASVPLKYGPYDITAMMDHGDHVAIIYASRFVAIAAGGKAEAILDLTPLLGPAVAANHYAALMQPDPAWAQRAGGVVYIGAGTGVYAPAGDKGYITAIDPQSGAVLWRSAPHVSSMGFAIRGSYIFSGYGIHGQPSAVFVIDRQSGRTVGRTAVDSPPSHLVLKGAEVYLRTYDRDYVFTIR